VQQEHIEIMFTNTWIY